MRVGNNVDSIPNDSRIAYNIANTIPKIDNQGDGYRSFAGIILGLLLCKDKIILLDEPEAFLHPAQAYFLGKWIGEHSDQFGSQLLICSHSSNFLSGLLTGTRNIEIFRLQRDGDQTTYNNLSPEVANKLVSNPILSSQRVIEGIFHKGVVVCEADADRAVYQSVAAVCHNSNREILFIHAHNKQSLAIVSDVLKKTGTPVAVIADIDILRADKDLDNVYKVLSGHALNEDIRSKREQLDIFIDELPEGEVLSRIKEEVEEFCRQLEAGSHTLDGARSALSRIKNDSSKWALLKKNGIDFLSNPIHYDTVYLIDELSKLGLFVVPVGELEGWMELGTHRKNKWIIPALEAIHYGKTPEGLKLFVGKILSFF